MTNEQIIDALTNLAKEHQAKIRIYHSDGLLGQIRSVLGQYESRAELSLLSANDFREEVLRWLAGIVIVTDSVANASTHSEKNARLRGLVEVLESAREKLGKMHFDLQTGTMWPDIFRSDYPTRHFLQRIRDLESEVKELREREERIAKANIAAAMPVVDAEVEPF
jgi:hypothetical protein